MKKISTLILTLLLTMSLAGCGGEETSSTPKNEGLPISWSNNRL